MSEILLSGGRVIDPASGTETVTDVLIRDGVVAALGAARPSAGAETIDARGLIIAPGFIDLHCHLRDPGQTHKETIASGGRAAAAGGFTTICCMPNTDPVIDTRSVVEYVLRTAAAESPVRVLPIGAVTKGQAGKELAELAELAEAGAVAFSDDGRPVATSALMRYALEYSRITGRPVIDHCEDLTLTGGAPANEGAVAARLGLRGWPAAAETIVLARDLELAALTGGRLHIAHVSTARSVDLIRQAKRSGVSVTAEVTPHHLTMTEEWLLGEGLRWPATGHTRLARRAAYDTRTKVNPPLRTRDDVEALIEGLADGTIDAIATDHAPHAAVDKLCDYDEAAFGISGLETALGAVLTLVECGTLSLHRVIEALTVGPLRVLGDLNGRASPGTIVVGGTADLTVFHPALPWTVDAEQFLSKGKNSPLDGIPLPGRVVLTIVGGKVVYRG
ncbi:MAG: dihydroorotase [Chloroflexota bacterium]|nr:dihydroorotase [Dehalococcoidia bacterium]MDW8253231.1 dihydroorotase [Chloroflexota bacterium]